MILRLDENRNSGAYPFNDARAPRVLSLFKI